VPTHFERVCSAISQLPSEVDFDVTSLPETVLSQGTESHQLSEPDPGSVLAEGKVHSGARQGVTPDTSFTEPEAKKREGKK
jgi:hypothetical protein